MAAHAVLSKIVIGMSLTTDISSDLLLAIGNRDQARATTSICPIVWDLVTESHSSRGREGGYLRGAMTALVREASFTVVTTHKEDRLLLLNPPPRSLSCDISRRSLW